MRKKKGNNNNFRVSQIKKEIDLKTKPKKKAIIELEINY